MLSRITLVEKLPSGFTTKGSEVTVTTWPETERVATGGKTDPSGLGISPANSGSSMIAAPTNCPTEIGSAPASSRMSACPKSSNAFVGDGSMSPKSEVPVQVKSELA